MDAATSTAIVRTAVTAVVALARDVRAANEYCEGCTQSVCDVGFLTSCRVTFRRTGQVAAVNYCAACLEIIDASVIEPGGSFGAVGLHTEIVRVDRVGNGRTAFPSAVAPTEYFGFYRNACRPAMRAWVQATIADLLTYPADEHDARCVAEEYATREIMRPLHDHETRLIAEVVRDLLTTRNAFATLAGR